MRRSRSPALLLRASILQKFTPPPPTHPPLCSPSQPETSHWHGSICPGVLNNIKFFSSATKPSRKRGGGSHGALGFGKSPNLLASQEADRPSVGESDAFPTAFGDGDELGITGMNGNDIEGGGDLSSLLEQSIDEDVPLGAEDNIGEEEVVDEVLEINVDQLESVVSILRSTLPQEIGSGLEKLEELSLTEEFVVRVFQDANVSGESLVSFFGWAIKRSAAVKRSRALHLLIQTIVASDEIRKTEAYTLWDLMKEFYKTEGIITTEILNQILSIFCKLEKAKAGLDVFDKFHEFGCARDGNTYYYTIEALGKKGRIDTAWSVCQKMLISGTLPDVEKIGKIVTFFCKKKVKDAHLVYLHAKEKNLLPGQDALSFLIGSLCRKDESAYLALEIFEECLQKTLSYEYRTFCSVAKSLARIKDAKAAKSLLLKMVDSGPQPRKSAFNCVITVLCKEGEVEEAITLINLMESRGLRPDVYTYSVIMTGLAKAGLMDEAYKIFCEAKKKHRVLTPMIYHTLIRGYCRIEEYEKALKCLEVMKEHGRQPNADEYSKLIKTLCVKALDWRTAEKLYGEMKERGLVPKGEMQSLIAAMKMLEEEEMAGDESKIET